MNRLRRYYTALRRYSRSKGFGIHSPFAFDFVLRVLRERCHYYAYEAITNRRRQALHLASSATRHPRIISLKNAKMLFRIVCRFQPSVILQCGVSYGISSTVVLDVDSSSRLIIFTGDNPHEDIYNQITRPYSSRITRYPTLIEAIDAYNESLSGKSPFILVNDVSDTDLTHLCTAFSEAIRHNGVIVVRNISRSRNVRRLWDHLKSSSPHGMSFSNDRIAIFVGLSHLPRQHYSLWF